MQTSTATTNVEEFLRLPEPREGHLELHHGEVVLMPPPKIGHQRLQWRIAAILSKLTTDIVGVEMAFRPAADYEVWQADVGLVSLERNAATRDDEYLIGAPELVVEVLSPSNTVDEINEKMNVCLSNGCKSFWTVDPKLTLVSVTGNDEITRRYRGSSSIPCSFLNANVLVSDIFLERL